MSPEMTHITFNFKSNRDHQIQTNKFWERVLGPEYELYLLNMDRCNEAVIRNASLPYRQHISTLPNRVRLHGGKFTFIYNVCVF